jgi:hypothetical protein
VVIAEDLKCLRETELSEIEKAALYADTSHLQAAVMSTELRLDRHW